MKLPTIKIVAAIIMFAISGHSFAADFVFKVPVVMDHLGKDIKRAGVSCRVYNKPVTEITTTHPSKGEAHDWTSVSSKGVVNRTLTVKVNYGFGPNGHEIEYANSTAHEIKSWMCLLMLQNRDNRKCYFEADSSCSFARPLPGTKPVNVLKGKI